MSLLLLAGLNVRLGDRPILRDVTLSVGAGEAVGLVGESGSGKSMTVRSVVRLLPDGATVDGSVRFDGADVLSMNAAALRRFRSQDVAMVFQDPRATVNPVRTVGDFLTEVLRDRGVGRSEATRRAAGLLTEVGVGDAMRRLSQRPYELSGGLLQRVVIAAALLTEPRLILADEPTTALDVTTQEEVVAILTEQRHRRSAAMLFITHDLELAAAVCDRIAVMYAGEIVEVLPASELHERARHPYTRALLNSRPGTVPPGSRLATVPGVPQSALTAPAGCVFADRCPHSSLSCVSERPVMVPIGSGSVACHLIGVES